MTVITPEPGIAFRVRVRGEYSCSPNDAIRITATRTGGSSQLADASVAAEVQQPNGVQDSVTLYDDGSHGDGQPNFERSLTMHGSVQANKECPPS